MSETVTGEGIHAETLVEDAYQFDIKDGMQVLSLGIVCGLFLGSTFWVLALVLRVPFKIMKS